MRWILIISTICMAAGTVYGQDPTPAPTEVRLPERFSEMAPADGGRLLLLRFKRLYKLAVFDVAAARITRYIDVPFDDYLFTAGKSKLVVFSREKSLLLRYDLATGAEELNVDWPTNSATQLLMGCNSDGPVMVCTISHHDSRDECLTPLVDLQTLQAISVPSVDGKGWAADGINRPAVVRVSEDGNTFCGWGGGYGVHALRGRGYMTEDNYLTDNRPIHCTVSCDGLRIFGNGFILNDDLKLVQQHPRAWYLPAVGSDLYLELDQRIGKPLSVTLCSLGDQQALLKLPEMPELNDCSTDDSESRIFFVASLNTLVTVPQEPDRLFVRHLAVEDVLRRGGNHFLYILSPAPVTALANADYVYTIAARTSDGALHYKLDKGPAGMTVSDEGVVRWKVPPHKPTTIQKPFAPLEPDEPGIPVSLVISDDQGQKCVQAFELVLK